MTATIGYDQESGAISPVQAYGLQPPLLCMGYISCDNSYQTGGYDVSSITGKFRQCKGIMFTPKDGYIMEFDDTADTMKVLTPVAAIAGHVHDSANMEVEEEAIAAPAHQRIYHGAVNGVFGNEIIRGGTSNATARITAHPTGYFDITDIGLDGVYFLTGELANDYNAHCTDAVSHLAADTVNDGVAQPTENSWAAIYVALNALKAAFNAHDAETGAYHPAAGTAHQITSNDATTPATASTLANELKTDFTAHIAESSGCYTLLSELMTAYPAHCALTTDSVHNTADVVNNNPTAIASHALADLIITANNLKAKYNAHDNETGAYHDAAGTAHQTTANDATDLASLITLLNEIKLDYEAHRVAVDIHSAADTVNEITSADAASAAHVQADAVNTVSASATGTILQTSEVLTGLSGSATATSSTIAIDVWDLAHSPATVQNVLNNSDALLTIDSPSVTLATGHARVDLTNSEIETLLSDAYTSLKVTYLKDAVSAGAIPATAAAEVANGTNLSTLTSIPFLAWGL